MRTEILVSPAEYARALLLSAHDWRFGTEPIAPILTHTPRFLSRRPFFGVVDGAAFVVFLPINFPTDAYRVRRDHA